MVHGAEKPPRYHIFFLCRQKTYQNLTLGRAWRAINSNYQFQEENLDVVS